jgi:Flp pilus assembly protein TadD
LEKALAVDPKHAKAHNNMALASIDLGELELAEAHYRESLAIEPQAAIYNDLGFVLEREGLPDEAADLYRKALELDPALASAHYNLAASLARRGELTAAEREFRAALAQDRSAAAYTGLGLVLAQQGRVDDAVASLEAAIEADPNHGAAYDQLGTVLADAGRLDKAAADYRALVGAEPTAANHRKLAQVLMRLGRTDEARRELELAKALDANADGAL